MGEGTGRAGRRRAEARELGAKVEAIGVDLAELPKAREQAERLASERSFSGGLNVSAYTASKHVHLGHGILSPPPRPVPVRRRVKVDLEDRFQDQLHGWDGDDN
jgi:hypothetical protein